MKEIRLSVFCRKKRDDDDDQVHHIMNHILLFPSTTEVHR